MASMEDEESERYQREIIEAELPGEEAVEEEDDEGDPYYFVRQAETGRGDIYLAARTGDVKRVKYLVEEEGVDVNKRDRWDAVPLYYSCLAGHPEVAHFLLEQGAVCNEFTFDGDRCHYAALTMDIRVLLRQYEQRPPPLSPLAADLRTLWDDPGPSSGGAESPWCDIVLECEGERIPLHRVILAARSPFFRRKVRPAADWADREGEERREVHLRRHPALTPPALRALLAYLYTERVDVPMEDLGALAILIRKCKLRGLEKEMVAEMDTHRYYFKSTRREERPRRFVLQPGVLPPEARLSADLGRVRETAAALEAAGVTGPAHDFADLLLDVGDVTFRAHCCILAARSDYFRALLERSHHFGIPIHKREAAAEAAPDSGACRPPESAAACSATVEEEGRQTAACYDGNARGGGAPAKSFAEGREQAAADATHSRGVDERSASPPMDGASGSVTGSGDVFPPGGRSLIRLRIADVEPRVFEVLLRFVYMDSVGTLAPDLLLPKGLEELFDAAERHLLLQMKRAVAECVVASWEATPPRTLERVCRVLLAADAFSVTLLREHCLRRVAAVFDRVSHPAAAEQERLTFESFVAAVAPQDGRDILDGSAVAGASRGNIEGGGLGGAGIGTLLQDLREAYLEDYGGRGQLRDVRAAAFDRRLQEVAQRAMLLD